MSKNGTKVSLYVVIPSQKGCKYKCNAFVSLPSFNGPLWELTYMHTFLIYLVIGCKIVSCEFVSCEFAGCEIVCCEIVVESLTVASFRLWNPLTSTKTWNCWWALPWPDMLTWQIKASPHQGRVEGQWEPNRTAGNQPVAVPAQQQQSALPLPPQRLAPSVASKPWCWWAPFEGVCERQQETSCALQEEVTLKVDQEEESTRPVNPHEGCGNCSLPPHG